MDNTPMSVKHQINADNLHPKESLVTWKSSVTSIVNTLSKIIILKDVYDTYFSKFYDEFYVTFFNLKFDVSVKYRLNNWNILRS